MGRTHYLSSFFVLLRTSNNVQLIHFFICSLARGPSPPPEHRLWEGMGTAPPYFLTSPGLDETRPHPPVEVMLNNHSLKTRVEK